MNHAHALRCALAAALCLASPAAAWSAESAKKATEETQTTSASTSESKLPVRVLAAEDEQQTTSSRRTKAAVVNISDLGEDAPPTLDSETRRATKRAAAPRPLNSRVAEEPHLADRGNNAPDDEPPPVPKDAASAVAEDKGEIDPFEAADGDKKSEPAASKSTDSCSSCEGACSCESCQNCESCDDYCACELDCPDRDVIRMFEDCCCLQRHNFDIRGWLEAGIVWNDNHSPDGFNGPVAFPDRDGEGQFNQGYVIMERTTNTEGYGFDIGGRIDLLYGTDYRFTTARGLDAHSTAVPFPKWNTDPRKFYGLAMPQAYGEVAWDNLKFKVGHFYTPTGYETVTAPDNFFYTHSYNFLYGGPFTFSGFLGTWTPNDQLSISGGLTNGWDNWDAFNEGQQSFLGGVTFKSSDEDTSLAIYTSTGDEFNAVGSVSNRTVVTTVFTRNITDRLSYVFENLCGFQQDGVVVPAPPGGAASAHMAPWYGIAQYAYYKINCCWTAGARAEWFRDDDGVRVAPIGDFAGNNLASTGGFSGNFWEVTLGLNWKPNGNFTFRPEVRYDWYSGTNPGGPMPFDGGQKNNQLLAGFDLIWLF